jgi:hypothetical protein
MVMVTMAIPIVGARRGSARRARATRQAVAAGLTVPVIYSLALPLVMLDLWVTAYQRICFPIYGIQRVARRRFFVVDRYRLPYLNAIEKLHCTYCSYANGVLAYTREIAARTEAYWCPIKHARPVRSAHRLYQGFFGYGDAASYKRGLTAQRRQLERPVRHGEHRP